MKRQHPFDATQRIRLLARLSLAMASALGLSRTARAGELSMQFSGGGDSAVMAPSDTVQIDFIWRFGPFDCDPCLTQLDMRLSVDPPDLGAFTVTSVSTPISGWTTAPSNTPPSPLDDYFLVVGDPGGTIELTGSSDVVVASLVIHREPGGAGGCHRITFVHDTPVDYPTAAYCGPVEWEFRWQSPVDGPQQFSFGQGNPGDADPVWNPHGLEPLEPLTVAEVGGGGDCGRCPQPIDPLCSHFACSASGWTAIDRSATVPYDCTYIGPHGPPVTWNSGGGNPGGYISTYDGNQDFYWRAPGTFAGDQSAQCGQALCFDVKSDELTTCPYTTNTPNLVVLTPSSGSVIAYDAPFAFANVPPNTWHHWIVPLDESHAGWHHPCDGTPLDPGELCDVLENLQSMDLLAEYGNGPDTGGLDNACFCPLPPICVEACCLPEGACEALDRDTCIATGGTPLGAGTACAGDADLDGRDDACVPPCTTPPGVGPDVSVVITADNAYRFGYGSNTAMLNDLGGIENCTAGEIFSCANGPETYTIPAAQTGDFLYIVAWSDDSDTQGVIARFQAGANPTIDTGQGNWEVYATGLNFDVCDGSPMGPTPSEINAQILLANANAGPASSSVGWVNTTGGVGTQGVLVFGEDNSSSAGLFSQVCAGAMGTAPRWMWYDGDPNDSINPFNDNPGAGGHREYLIFRLPLSAVPGMLQACCLPDGTCQNLEPACCMATGGTPGGAGTQCTATEACCLPDDACQMLDPVCCTAAGGSPAGAGTDCLADSNDDGLPDACFPPCPPLRLYGVLTNGTLPSGDESYTFAEISTDGATAGNVTPLFTFTLPFGIGGMAFNPESCKFVVTSGEYVDGKIVEIDPATQTVGTPRVVTGLPAGNTYVQAIEYKPDEPEGRRMLISFGAPGVDNRIAAIDSIGTVVQFTAATGLDLDSFAYSSLRSEFVNADSNNPPFEIVTSVFPTPSFGDNWAFPNDYTGDYWEPACDDAERMFFSKRGSSDLWYILRGSSGNNAFVRVGPHLAPTPSAYAVGLAFGDISCCCPATAFSEDFDSPAPPDDVVFFGGDPIYVSSISSSTGGNRFGNANQDAFILPNFADIILNDQSGTGYFLYENTVCNGSYSGVVWSTLAPVPVCPNTCYEFSFYLTNRNTASVAVIVPRINGEAIAAGVSAVGSWGDGNPAHRWQQFSFTWNSEDATTADLSLFNSQSACGGNDFGIDTIALTKCPPCGSPARITSAFSRQSTGDIPINIAGHVENGDVTTDPRQCAITEVHICFDVPPCPLLSQDAVTLLSQTGCPLGSQAAYAPDGSGSTMTMAMDGQCLVLSFTPKLPNGATYKFVLGPELTSIAGQSIELRALAGDVNSDGLVNGTDRSIVVGCWTGSGYDVKCDINCDGQTNATDRSIAVGAWTGTANCAP